MSVEMATVAQEQQPWLISEDVWLALDSDSDFQVVCRGL